MCSGFTHQHTVEETYPRSQTVKPPPFLLLPLFTPSFSPHDSILPFLSLNTLLLANLQHSVFRFPFAPPSHSSTLLSVLPSLYLSSLLFLLPRGFHHAQSFSIFHVFYLSTEERMCEQLPNKGKTPSCHLRKCCREEGGREEDRRGQRELDNMGSKIKREYLREGDGKMRNWKCCALNMCYINTGCAFPEQII